MKDSTIKIAAIVVAYNINVNDILPNIQTYKKFVNEIIIVDNSDNKTDLNEISKNKYIKYITLNGNEGIAKALNIGIEYAIKHQYDYVLTMDQDSKFDNNLIEEYLKYIENNIIIYSPNYIIERKRTRRYKQDTKELYWTMTSGNMLNLKLYKRVGTFREDFFIDGVDYEYCIRARKMGYKILQCNNARLIHNPGITRTKKILFWNYKYGYMNPIRMYYQVRNLTWIAKKYNSLRSREIIIIKFLKILLLFENKKVFFKMYNKAKKDFKNGNMGKLVIGESD